MSPLILKLREIAPSIVITVTWTPDPHCSWDGDGPDPREEGLNPYDVDVVATVIRNGEFVEGKASLGSTWKKHDEMTEDDEDVHGYLPQMLQEAIKELDYTSDHSSAALRYLDAEMKRRWQEEQDAKTQS